MKSHYYSTLDTNITGSHDLAMTTDMSQSQDITSSSTVYTNYPLVNCDEPLYEDPGHKEDEIYSWSKGRKIPRLKPHKLRYFDRWI